jgi:hypothetical protein
MARKLYVVWGEGNKHLRTGDQTATRETILNVRDLNLDLQQRLFEAMFCKKKAA